MAKNTTNATFLAQHSPCKYRYLQKLNQKE